MARSLPDCRPLLLLLIAGTLFAAPARITLDRETPIQFEGGAACFRGNFSEGTLESCDVILRQGTGTVIKAKNASAKRLSDGYEDGEWQFTGEVHIEFENAVIDSDSATVLFADNRLKEVHVRGSPARFSHQLKDATRRNQGRATAIDYDAASSILRLTGDAWYSDGRNEVNFAALTYNMNSGDFRAGRAADSDTPVRIIIRPEKRVPPPRTPDRSTSQ
jgi:lipopolysaccharide transport protein LptA